MSITNRIHCDVTTVADCRKTFQQLQLALDTLSPVPSSRLINTTPPLTGGGDLSADRTIALTTPLALNYGGSNANLTASLGGIIYSTATAMAVLSGTATANKILLSGASAAPVWSTPTFPNASATALKWMRSDGTNWIASTGTLAESAVTAGKIPRSDGTNWLASTVAYTDAPTSGGIPYYSSTTALSSSALLTLHALLVGGGAGNPPTPVASLGTSTQVLHGAAAGDPTWSAVNLAAGGDVTGLLPAANLVNSGVHTGDAVGTFPTVTLNATINGITSLPNLVTVGTLTGGATGAGFTVALTTSTITGTLAAARMPNAGVFTGDATTTFPALTIGNAAITAVKMVNAGVHTGDAVGTFPTVTLNASQPNITTAANLVSVGTITTGTWSATAIAVAKGGSGITVQPPSFYAFLNGNLTNQTGNAYNKVAFGAHTSFDIGSYYDSTNSRWKPLVAGTYFIYGQMKIDSIADGFTAQANIYKNGSLFIAGPFTSQGATTACLMSVSGLMAFDGVNDYVELWSYGGTVALGVYQVDLGTGTTFMFGIRVST